MIITVTLNPCIDRTVVVKEFLYGGMNRITESREDASGKGVNVAIVYKQLGGEALCTGINYALRGDLIRDRLNALGIQHDFVDVPGEVRVNMKILDQNQGVITEVNEPGFPVTPSVIEALKVRLQEYTASCDMCILSGSVPKGMTAGVYRELMEAVNWKGKWVLDAEGELFLEGIQAHPFLIKPNLYELEKALNRPLKEQKEIVAGARKFLDHGVTLVGVSMGEKGAILVNDSKAFYAPPLPIEVKSTVGAGDSMVAAFCMAVEMGADLKEILRMGTAAAAATVISEGTELCSHNTYEFLLPQVNVVDLRM